MPKRPRRKDDQPLFELDETRLDEHWIEQPRIMFKAMKDLADAKLAVDEAKTHLQVVEAETSKEVRSDPVEYGIEKVTEKAITECLVSSEPVVEATASLQEKKHHADICQAMVTALDHRKKALEKLVDLHGQSYFATPQASGESGKKMREVEKKSVRKKSRRS